MEQTKRDDAFSPGEIGPETPATSRKGYAAIQEKLIQHKIVLDLDPKDQPFTGIPQFVDLELYRDGEWYCTYLGFLDANQLAALRLDYEIKEDALDPELREVNRELLGTLGNREPQSSTIVTFVV